MAGAQPRRPTPAHHSPPRPQDVEGLQRLLEEQRLANPAIADPIDRAIHIIEGPDAHHDHGPEPAGAYLTPGGGGPRDPRSTTAVGEAGRVHNHSVMTTTSPLSAGGGVTD